MSKKLKKALTEVERLKQLIHLATYPCEKGSFCDHVRLAAGLPGSTIVNDTRAMWGIKDNAGQ